VFNVFRLAPLMASMAFLPLSVPADDVLPNSRAEALSMEAKDALPLTPFYDPPQPFEKASPGTLIRSEPFVGYSVPKGARAVRILYHSRALNGGMNYEAYETHDAQTFDPVTDLYWPFTAFGIKASYPAFDVARMLTPPVLARYQDVTTKGCWYYAYAALKEIGRQRGQARLGQGARG
jgi:hypothetical protein